MWRRIALVVSVVTASPAVLWAAETPMGEGAFTFLKAALSLGAGLGIGIAAFGGALGQGKAAAAALDGIARNPEAAGKVMTPMIIGLALIESLVIFALLIAFLLFFKI